LDLASAWNLDPWLLSVFALATLPLWSMRSSMAGQADRRRWYALSLVVLFVAFVSPLCALSSALFSARVVHHLLLISVAAPLVALAFPAGRAASGARLPWLVLIHVATVWVWHAPAPYAAALASDVLYWIMEATLVGTAALVWRDLLARQTPALRGGLAHLAIIALMGLLGALITFAPVPLYTHHFLTTEAFGLTALEDQQLAGLIMWVPAIVPNLIAALIRLRQFVEGERALGMASR
jgi:putative membrane protein